jgi:hypothetical protein
MNIPSTPPDPDLEQEGKNPASAMLAIKAHRPIDFMNVPEAMDRVDWPRLRRRWAERLPKGPTPEFGRAL